MLSAPRDRRRETLRQKFRSSLAQADQDPSKFRFELLCDGSYSAKVLASRVLESNRRLRSDKEVVLAAVKHNGRALFWAGDGLQADKEVVLAAIKQDPTALKFASDDLREDLDVKSLAEAGKRRMTPRSHRNSMSDDHNTCRRRGESLRQDQDPARKDSKALDTFDFEKLPSLESAETAETLEDPAARHDCVPEGHAHIHVHVHRDRPIEVHDAAQAHAARGETRQTPAIN